MIQLPNDSVLVKYTLTKPYLWEQVFFSMKHFFKGTEKDFINAGFAYQYIEIDRFTRWAIKP